MSTRTVIRRPIITEKASRLKEKHNIYVFEVDRNSNKIEIKQSIQELFKVTVEDVRTSIAHGKIKSRGRFKGRRADWKRAVVQLKKGDTIEFFEGA